MMQENDMISERELFSLTYSMSEMAAKHKNDVISNALAATAHKLTELGLRVKMSDLTDIDKTVIRYFHANKGDYVTSAIGEEMQRPRSRQRDAGFHGK